MPTRPPGTPSSTCTRSATASSSTWPAPRATPTTCGCAASATACARLGRRRRRSSGPFQARFSAGVRAADLVLAASATGVVAYNDEVAVGVINRLADRGVRVPEDVSVVGFDDTPLAGDGDAAADHRAHSRGDGGHCGRRDAAGRDRAAATARCAIASGCPPNWSSVRAPDRQPRPVGRTGSAGHDRRGSPVRGGCRAARADSLGPAGRPGSSRSPTWPASSPCRT